MEKIQQISGRIRRLADVMKESVTIEVDGTILLEPFANESVPDRTQMMGGPLLERRNALMREIAGRAATEAVGLGSGHYKGEITLSPSFRAEMVEKIKQINARRFRGRFVHRHKNHPLRQHRMRSW